MIEPQGPVDGGSAPASWIVRTRDRVVAALRKGRVLLVGGLMTMALLSVAPYQPWSWSVLDGLGEIRMMLSGKGGVGDISTNFVGFRRLVEGRDPYAVIGPALKEIGVDWPLSHRSTHPPTAYLLVAPYAYLPVGEATRWWCLTGFGLLFVSFRCYGVPLLAALGLTLMAGLWRPLAPSFYNLTLVWLAGVAVGYRFRKGTGLASGIGLGVASLTKVLPAGLVLYFLLSRRWRAILGLGAVWALALGIVAWLHPGAISGYLGPEVAASSWATIIRTDNSSVLRQAHRFGGIAGVGTVLAYGLVLLWHNRQALLRPAGSPEYAFFLYSFLAVALLPISWGYSLAPLLPVLGYFFLRGSEPHILLSAAVFLALAVLPGFSEAPVLGTLGASQLFWLTPPAEGGNASVVSQ